MKNYNPRDDLPCCLTCLHSKGYVEYLTCRKSEDWYKQVDVIGICDLYVWKHDAEMGRPVAGHGCAELDDID